MTTKQLAAQAERERLLLKYRTFISGIPRPDATWEEVKAAFPDEYPGALWNEWQACVRHGLLKETK